MVVIVVVGKWFRVVRAVVVVAVTVTIAAVVIVG